MYGGATSSVDDQLRTQVFENTAASVIGAIVSTLLIPRGHDQANL